MPVPAWFVQFHNRLRFSVKISTAKARLTSADLDKTFTVAVKDATLSFAQNLVDRAMLLT